ncbi:MAG: YggS family pyridoxal phosphate-dependent enzyme [Bacillaceae bacterium]|nr:YggS family pyridoxal phosphate-dependent enzyme [Bacillaceae bacterium]
MNVSENLAEIQERIAKACEKSSRNPEEVNIIAVTKYVSVERAREAIQAGIRHLGENRVDGFLHKQEVIQEHVDWHFIGTLQSRKVKKVIDQLDYLHSLDRLSLAKEIEKRASKSVSCFVQVNVSGEESKHGMKPQEVENFIRDLKEYPSIQVIGLMTMAPYTDDENVLRGCFRTMRELRDQIREKNYSHAPCNYLSMGMSNDFEIAVEEGATHVRIGTSLVGKETV